MYKKLNSAEIDEVVEKWKKFISDFPNDLTVDIGEFTKVLDSKATELKSFYDKLKADGMDKKSLYGLFEKNLIGLTVEMENIYFPRSRGPVSDEEAHDRGELFKSIMSYIATEVHKKQEEK